MFEKLATRYNVENPLKQLPSTSGSFTGNTRFGSALSSPTDASVSSFSATTSYAAPTPLPSVFSPEPTHFVQPSHFGFVANVASSASSPFNSAPTATFGSPTLAHPSPPFAQHQSSGVLQSPPTLTGRNPRDLLVAFYQQHNPAKIAEVEKLLEKYRGNEEQMFRNLAKKYQLDPAIFGLAATPVLTSATPPSISSGFGKTSMLRGGQAFGGASGGGNLLDSTMHTTNMGGGFGQISSLGSTGGGFPSNAIPQAGHVFGGSSTSGFGATSFGSLASFGSSASAPPSNFSGLGSPGGFASSFGSSTPFGAPRR